MAAQFYPEIDRIRDVVTAEIEDAGGRISECLADSRQLFLRSVLPQHAEVVPGDEVQGGVAVMACESLLRVHPYNFRKICSNGAILSRTTGCREIERINFDANFEVVGGILEQTAEAVRECAQPAVFNSVTEQMRDATMIEADLALQMMPFMRMHRGRRSMRWFAQILEHFETDGDKSAYGLLNAITAVAREERDPESRWDLEEFGGGILATLNNSPQTPSAVRSLMPVG